jgi:putative ABC transport system permease protein
MPRLDFGRRLRSRFWRLSPREEVGAELGFHLEMRARELERQGLTPEAARAEAERRFGNLSAVARECRSLAAERNRRMDVADAAADLARDLRDAFRQMIRRPAFTLTAVVTLAVGIGANAALFSLVKAVLLRPLAPHEPDRVIRLYSRTSTETASASFAYPEFADLSASAPSLAPLGAVNLATISLEADHQRDQLVGEIASAGYFEIIGMRAAAGRTLGAADDRRNAAPAAMLSHRYWSRRFDRDSSIIGRPVTINNRPYTIAGVADARVTGSFVGAPVDVWIALEPSLDLLGRGTATERARRVLNLIGRLAPGATVPQAQGELDAAAPDLARERNEEKLRLELGPGTLVHGGRRTLAAVFLGVVMALAGLVLVVAAANVANLLLARALSRKRELAVRIALGAGRGRLVRQLSVESFTLAAMGGAAGLLLTLWVTETFGAVALLPGFELRLDLSPDMRVFGFTVALTLVAGLAAGVAPAMTAASGDVVSALKEGSGTGGSRRATRLRTALVVAQVAVSAVLLVAAGLLAKSARAAAAIDLGFETAGAVVTDLDLEGQDYTEARGRDFYRQLVARVASLPGVSAVAIANRAPLDSSTPTIRATRDAGMSTNVEPASTIDATYHTVGPAYFDAVRMPLVAGRPFDTRDREGATQVAIVNETLARRLFEGRRDVLGERFTLVAGTATERRREISGAVQIVGVAREAKYRTVGEPPQPHLYLPSDQHYGPGMTLIVRSDAGSPPVTAVHDAIAALDPAVQGFFTRTLVEHTRVALVPARLASSVSGIIAAIALGLGAVGLYGVIACLVGERTRELGVRMALGASRRAIAQHVLRRAGMLAAIGAGLGLALAAAGGRVLSGLLYNVSSVDPVVFLAVAVTLCAVTLLAAWLPARRASRIDPLVALRAD